jgi:hypothetical protein
MLFAATQADQGEPEPHIEVATATVPLVQNPLSQPDCSTTDLLNMVRTEPPAAPESPNVNNHSAQQPDPPPRSIDPSMDRSLADLPTTDPFMDVVGVPQPGTKAYLCFEHMPKGGGKAEPGCGAFVVPFADPDGYHELPNDQIRAIAEAECERLGKTFTGIIKYPNPAVDEAERFHLVMSHAKSKPLAKLAEPGGSVLPEGLKVSDLIDQAKMKSVTTLKLEHDPGYDNYYH